MKSFRLNLLGRNSLYWNKSKVLNQKQKQQLHQTCPQ